MESILDSIEKPSQEQESKPDETVVTQIPTRIPEVTLTTSGENAASPIQFATGGNPPMPIAIPDSNIEVPVPTQEDVKKPIIHSSEVEEEKHHHEVPDEVRRVVQDLETKIELGQPPKVSDLKQQTSQQHHQQHHHHRKEHYAVIEDDPYLKQYEHQINDRNMKFNGWKGQFESEGGSLIEFARQSYKRFGLNINKDGNLEYREWAPNAKEVAIFGDFNNWNRESHKCKRDDFGVWAIVLPKNADGTLPIKHKDRFKACITKQNGEKVDRVPAWAKLAWQNPHNNLFEAVFWNPEKPYEFKSKRPKQAETLRIYEAHVGMSSEDGKVSTYIEFADNILPRIREGGYNCVQLMAIQEHSYYASFGYHVTSFFAPSSRCGTPDELKYLVDKAHSMNIAVIMDCIHSHASSNVFDGISQFDGTDHQYCHGGAKGKHSQWDSMLFDYSKYEVLRFLLSNLSYFLDEFQFDGFRFDAVTSILYHHHGIGIGFSGDYREYFGMHVDIDGILYLMLANTLVHQIHPDAITIAEDVSGMPTLCRKVEEGGMGFDYRLSMYIPDMWIKYLKEQKDEEWNMGSITFNLTNRRFREKCVAYSESHDQAIVGDKTISMWLFDREIYFNMKRETPSVVVDRGVALHKMIRLVTMGLGGEAYLNFMGNEFGHPEWIDFPREGNSFSYHYCRRQWHLADDERLRYSCLKKFDKAFNDLEQRFHWMKLGTYQYVTLSHDQDKLIVFERGDLLFIFNFHPTNSYEHYRVGTRWGSDHCILLDSDWHVYGGFNRLEPAHKIFFPVNRERWQNRDNFIQLYIPNRTAIVLCAEENLEKYGLNINGRGSKNPISTEDLQRGVKL